MKFKYIPKPSEELQRAVDKLQGDYVLQGNEPFRHFFCPILHEDTHTELCKGHIVPEAFGGAWVPQRKDVDNFYGYTVEGDFVACIRDRDVGPMNVFTDKQKYKVHSPQIMFEGNVIEHYFPDDLSKVPAKHAPTRFVDDDGNILCDVAFKISPEEVSKLQVAAAEGRSLDLVIDQDYVPVVVASVLKAAHLTMFGWFKYEWVFSVPGRDLAVILKKFYVDNRGRRKTDVYEGMKAYFRKHIQMIKPFSFADPSLLAGTVNDKRVVALVNNNQQPFVMGIIVKVGTDTFVVFVPANATHIDSYFSFLSSPPASVMMHIVEFRDEKWQVIDERRMDFASNQL